MKTKNAVRTGCSAIAIAGLISMFSASAAEIANSQSRKMDEPMAGEMKKKGMKQGEVKKHEEEWNRKMKERIANEEKAMANGTAKK